MTLTDMDKVLTEMASESADLLDANDPTTTAAAEMLDNWRRALSAARDLLGTRDMLYRHVRTSLHEVLARAKEQVAAGADPQVVLSEVQGRLDKILPLVKK